MASEQSPQHPASTDVSTLAPSSWTIPLDESLYFLDDEEERFMKSITRIDDDKQLKDHVISVQREAWKVFQYPCIRIFEFMRLKLARLPAYQELLILGRTRKDAIFLDLGCCFGNDSRKLVLDGYPVENCIASDLRKELWQYGHSLFRSNAETFPVPFLQGDILNASFLDELPDPPPSPPSTRPDLRTLDSLNPLRGQVSAVFTGAFFHLFSEQEQIAIARKLAGLLSPEPGSMLIGVQGGCERHGIWSPSPDYKMLLFSPDTWQKMWEDVFGGPNVVRVQTRLRVEIGGPSFFGLWPNNKSTPYTVLEWSVTRL